MLCRKISKNLLVVTIRIDHSREFDQDKFVDCCDKNDIPYIFLAPITPQQNGVLKRKK